MTYFIFDIVAERFTKHSVPIWDFLKVSKERYYNAPSWSIPDILRDEIKLRNSFQTETTEIFVVNFPAKFPQELRKSETLEILAKIDKNSNHFIIFNLISDFDFDRQIDRIDVIAIFNSLDKAIEYCKKNPRKWYIRGFHA